MKTYHDITGDGGSNIVGQVTSRARAITHALSGVGRLVAVGSGKGGVGKSTVTMALARALAEAGGRVTILDADLNGPSQARLAGLEGRPWLPGNRGLVPPRRADGIAVVSMGSLLPAASPLRFDTVSSGEQQTWRATRELAMFAQILASTEWGKLDVLLLDLPPGTERTVQFAELLIGSLPGAHGRSSRPRNRRLGFVMVTVPSAVSRGVVARTLTALAPLAARSEATGAVEMLGTVENMAGYYCKDCGQVRPLFPEATAKADVPLKTERLARVPFDPELATLCDRGWPVGPLPEALRDLEALARQLLETSSTPPGTADEKEEASR